jgi:hypothetical protein
LLPIRARARCGILVAEKEAVMTRYMGGSEVRGGYYLSLDRWHIFAVSGEEGTLEGAGDERFVKLALPAVIVVVAALSLGYAMFLPFIGFALVAKALGGKLVELSKGLFHAAASAASPPARPGEAYLAGEPDEEREKAAEAELERLARLEQEIAERREQEHEPKA